jgi:hypothetical protein
MMRRGVWLAFILLPLGACYVQPQGPNYSYAVPGYPPAGFPPPPPLPADPYAGAYPGYSYNDGAPVYYDAGVAVPLVLFGGEWGYYDHGHHWHRAPEGVSRDLQAHWGGGRQFHPNAPPHPEPGNQWRGGPPGGQAAYRPAEPPRAVRAPPVQAAPGPAQAAPLGQAEHEHRRDCPPGQHC